MQTTAPRSDPPADDDGPATDLLPPRRRRGLAPLTAILGVCLVAALAFFGGVEAQKHEGGSGNPSANGARAGQLASLAGNGSATGGFRARRNGGGFGASAGARAGQGAGGGFGGGGGAGGFGGGGFAGGAGGGVTSGTVKLIKGTSLYVTDTSGNTVKVALTGSSAVTKTETTTIAGIHPGDTVLAIGTAGKNGIVAAKQVRVTPAATNS
jgi:hypothetical protein